METIVLVHGAWSDASAWDQVVPILKAKGYEVIAVNLPGHGKDNTSFANITLAAYVETVKRPSAREITSSSLDTVWPAW